MFSVKHLILKDTCDHKVENGESITVASFKNSEVKLVFGSNKTAEEFQDLLDYAATELNKLTNQRESQCCNSRSPDQSENESAIDSSPSSPEDGVQRRVERRLRDHDSSGSESYFISTEVSSDSDDELGQQRLNDQLLNSRVILLPKAESSSISLEISDNK